MIKFSVTIPAYKGKFLNEAINSVLSQTYQNYELIIVDDCSPEDLKRIVDQYSDNRIRYYRNDKNYGALNVVDNWNACLGYSSGDYIICMGDDDRLLPCCLEEYVNLINKYPTLNVFHAWTQLIDDKNNLKTILEPRPEYESFFSLTYYRWKGRRQYIGDFCYRVDHLRAKNGFYWLPLAWGTDDISAARAALDGGIANTQKTCFEYRQSDLTISNSTNHTRIKLEASLKEKVWYKELLSDLDSSTLDEPDNWYFTQIVTLLEPCSLNKMADEIVLDITSNPSRLIKWLVECKKYGVRKSWLLKRILIHVALIFIKHK